MAKRVPKAFMQAAQTHRNRLDKALTGHANSVMKKLYDEAQGQLVSKLHALVKSGKGLAFTAHQNRMALIQLRQGQALIAQRMAGKLGDLGGNAQEVGLKGLINDVAKLSKKFTGAEVELPVAQASVFAGVVKSRKPSLLEHYRTVTANYGVKVVRTVERRMALGLLQGEAPGQMMDDVAELIDGEWWQGERIVRTEMSYAFNSAHDDGITESAREFPMLRKRWEEHCSELGEPLDDRVAVDSIALHGQVAAPGSVFSMPATAPYPPLGKTDTDVSPSLVGLSWYKPPNRPNDRSVLMPWMPDWGIPGWEYVDGARIPVQFSK